MSDYAYKHVQSAAAYIAGKHDNRNHHPILAHRHIQTQHTSKFNRIMNHSRDQLIAKMKYDPHLREALSNSIHAAHIGGHLDMTRGGGFGAQLFDSKQFKSCSDCQFGHPDFLVGDTK